MAPYMQRKYIDLILKVSSKWVNWDPPIQVRVGSYGTIDKEKGDLLVEGNIYDPDFQQELDKHGVNITMANFPPKDAVEGDFVIASRGAKHQDVDIANDILGIANAYIKGQWLFERGERGAILIMHSPRQVYLPTDSVVLEHLYQVDKLVNKHLVTSVHDCDAYTMYLSDTSGDKVSLALVAQEPTAGVAIHTAGANQSLSWWVDHQSGFLRKACDKTGNYKFTPLYSLKRPMRRFKRFFRDADRPEPSGNDLWHASSPPWDPLDEDGVEDPFSTEVTDVDPFAPVTPPSVIA